MLASGEPSEFLISTSSGCDARSPTRIFCVSPETIDTDAGVDGPSLWSPHALMAGTAAVIARTAIARIR